MPRTLQARRSMRHLVGLWALLGAATGAAGAAAAQQPSWMDRLSVGGWVGGATSSSFQRVGADEQGCALLFRPDIDFDLTERDRLHATVGLASGNGLDRGSPFVLSPWAADLADGVTDINGSGRDVLLTAWYRHAFDLGRGGELALTAGLIDATEYLDQNAFSNDELGQFMNEAMVNGPNGFAPSYDVGLALEWCLDGWSVNGVAMHVNENAMGDSCEYAGAQLGYRALTAIGEGNYRLYGSYNRDRFLDADGNELESLFAGFLTADQELGDDFGVWARIGQGDRSLSVDYTSLLSGGLCVDGSLWGRELDECGIGCAYLDGGDTGILDTLVLESYLRLGFFDGLALTLDSQYMRDRYESDAGSDVHGWILSARLGYAF